ncbi:hypothetical protein JCM5353_007065 [Sporobolomyces roseus]
MPHPDPHTNRYLLVSVFIFGTILLYLTTHRPQLATLRPPTTPPGPLRSSSKPSIPLQRPLVSSQIIKHRIVAIGDIHGDYTALTKILRKAELIDLKGGWIGNETILVQTGDIVDRGKDTIACYKFMQTLRGDAEKKGGTVVSLLGNHEIMNALGDWRYVNPQDIASFGGERNRREALLTGWIGQEWRSNYSITARVPYLSHTFPSTSTLTTFPLTPKGSSDRRFISEPTPFQDEEGSSFRNQAISFVHGGITPEYLETLSRPQSPISEINRIGHEIMQSLLENPAAPMSLPRGATMEQRLFWSEKGVMWNREWAMLEEREICDRVERACEMMRVKRLVMGHTPHFEGILSRCRGKVLLIDTGISKAYGGSHSYLEILHTLTPASLLSYEQLSELGSDDERMVLGQEVSEDEWIEEELITAQYEESGNGGEDRGRREEVLVRDKRRIRISPE